MVLARGFSLYFSSTLYLRGWRTLPFIMGRPAWLPDPFFLPFTDIPYANFGVFPPPSASLSLWSLSMLS